MVLGDQRTQPLKLSPTTRSGLLAGAGRVARRPSLASPAAAARTIQALTEIPPAAAASSIRALRLAGSRRLIRTMAASSPSATGSRTSAGPAAASPAGGAGGARPGGTA